MAKLMHRLDVLEATRLGEDMLRRLVNLGHFPQPLLIGGERYWMTRDVVAWLRWYQRRKQDRRGDDQSRP